jgi:hypothetical protein
VSGDQTFPPHLCPGVAAATNSKERKPDLVTCAGGAGEVVVGLETRAPTPGPPDWHRALVWSPPWGTLILTSRILAFDLAPVLCAALLFPPPLPPATPYREASVPQVPSPVCCPLCQGAPLQDGEPGQGATAAGTATLVHIFPAGMTWVGIWHLNLEDAAGY